MGISSSSVARCKHRKLHELENLQLHASNLLPAKQIMFCPTTDWCNAVALITIPPQRERYGRILKCSTDYSYADDTRLLSTVRD